MNSSVRGNAAAVLASIPWCCVLPAALSLTSATGVVVARVWLAKLSWFLLPVAVLLLSRAFWSHYVRQQGAPWTRFVTWGAAALTVALWMPRLWGIWA